MGTPRPKSKLAEISKYKVAYMIAAVVGLVWFFARSFRGESSARADDCKEQLQYANEQNRRKDSVVYSLMFRIKVQEEAEKQLPAVADSVLRNKTP